MTQDVELEQDITTFWSLLFEIIADMEKRLFAHMAEHGLTPPQFYVLKTLVEHGGRCRIGQIAEDHHLTNATMTGLIKRMEAMSPALVCREQSASDGRAVDVMLTEAGQQRFLDVQEGILNQVRMVLELLPTDERRLIIERIQTYFGLLGQLFPVISRTAVPDAADS